MALEPSHTGRRSTSALSSSASPPHSDYFGLPSHSGSTALTSPSLEASSPYKHPASFHSLHGIQEAAESVGLAPPPGSAPLNVASHDSQPASFYTASSDSNGHDPSVYTDPVQYDYAHEYHSGEYSYGDDTVYNYSNGQDYNYGDDQIHYDNYPGENYGSAFGVDPLYADDGPDEEELSRVPSTRSRRSSYVGLGISEDRSPSVLSGRRSPLRFPSNPNRPGSPMRLPPSPGPGCSPQRVPPSPGGGPRRQPSPRSPSYHQRQPSPKSPGFGPQRLPSRPESPVTSGSRSSPSSSGSRPTSGSSLRLPPSPSPGLSHSPRAPSPLATSWEAPEPEPEPEATPRALPQPPEMPASMRIHHGAAPSTPNSGATQRMVAAWENHAPASVTPTRQARPLPMPMSAPAPSHPAPSQQLRDNSPSSRRISQKYLAEKETKPLPIPTATPIPASAAMPWPPPPSARSGQSGDSKSSPRSRRVTPSCSPIKGLSPNWSLFNKQEHQGEVDSPKSPTKDRISLRHPLKDIKNAFSNLRRIGHKEKDEPTGWGTASVGVHGDRPNQRIDEDWFRRPLDPPQPLLDRMGDAEMSDEEEMRTGGVLWLATLPGSTRHGDWMTAWASLTRNHLSVAYVPVITGGLYGAPRPVPPRFDDELAMRSCTDVRPLPANEVADLHLPPLPEQGDILQLEFMHGAKRYLAVDRGSSAAWIAALSDVLLGLGAFSPSLKSYHEGSLRPGQLDDIAKFGDTWVAGSSEPSSWHTAATAAGSSPRTLPHQPSPVRSQHTGLSAAALEVMAEEADVPPTPPPKSRPRSALIADRMATFSPEIKPTPPLKLQKKKESGTTPPLKPQTRKESGATQRTQDSGTSQTQHTGTTGAAATVGVRSQPTGSSHAHSQPLPKERDAPRGARPGTGTPLRAASLQQIDPLGTSIADRIRSWQPPQGTPPPGTAVSRTGSQKSSQLSFDPSDLNPSRSASQIRPARSAAGIDLAAVDAGLARLPVLKEAQWGLRSPARKAVPKYVEEVEKGERPRTADLARLPDPEPVPEPSVEPVDPVLKPVERSVHELPSAAQQHVLPDVPKATEEPPTSPRPRRLNTRIAAAMEKFESSPRLNGTSSPAVKSPVAARSPLLAAKSSAVPPLLTTKSPAVPKSPKPPSTTMPIHAPVARPTASAALLESAVRSDVSDEKSSLGVKDKDALAPPNLAANLAPPKRPGSAASVGSATSVRDRIEALSRAAASPVSTTPKRLPVRASTASAKGEHEALRIKGGKPLSPTATGSRSTGSLPLAGIARSPAHSPTSRTFPQPALRSVASPPPSFRSLSRLPSHGPTAPLSLRKKPLADTASTLKARRTLTIANPDPESPDLVQTGQMPEGLFGDPSRDLSIRHYNGPRSELSMASEPRESITGVLAGYEGPDEPAIAEDGEAQAEDEKADPERAEEHAAEVEAREAAQAAENAEDKTRGTRGIVLADMPASAAEPDAGVARAADLADPTGPALAHADPALDNADNALTTATPDLTFAPEPVLAALSANHTEVTDQLRILNTDLGAVTSLLNESTGHQAATAADAQHRLVVLDQGLRLVHAGVGQMPPDLAGEIKKIQDQLASVLAGMLANAATLEAVHKGLLGESAKEGEAAPAKAGDDAGPAKEGEGAASAKVREEAATEAAANDEARTEKALPPPPGEAKEADKAEEPLTKSADVPATPAAGPVDRASTPAAKPGDRAATATELDKAVVPTAEPDKAAEMTDKAADPADPTMADKAIDPTTDKPAPDSTMAELENIKLNIDFLATQVEQLKDLQKVAVATAGAAGAQAVMAKLEEMEGIRAAQESKRAFEAEERATAAAKAAEEAKAEAEKAKAEAAEKAKADAAKVKPAEVTETKDVPKDAPAEPEADKPKEDAPPPPPPPPPAATVEQVEALTAQITKLAEKQAQSMENQSKISDYLGQLNEYIITVISKQGNFIDDSNLRYDELTKRDATIMEAVNGVSAAQEALFAKMKEEYAEGLRGLGLDLHSSISGERLNFIEAMEKATSMKLETHTRDFLENLNGDITNAHSAMRDLADDRTRIQEDIAEMMVFISKHAKKSGIAMETFPPNIQESLRRYADAMANPDAVSPQPGARPLPLPPAP